MRAILPLFWLLSPGLGLAVLACAGGDLTLPNNGAPADLTAVSGDGQQATIGSRLPQPLVVQVTDAAGRPVAEVPLVFRFQTAVPDAEIDPASVATDSTGHASVRVRLGTVTGAQTIEATIAQDAGPDVRATFGVTALEKRGHGDGDH
ncbi:MAG TPA: Ig-like domain-containing protein [Gemmatimonadales bacterium]|nr:Ig-like domain-containing protein [Gemmatimonadales bacterium]